MNKLSIISFILLSFLTAHASLHAGFKERMKERLPAILVAKDKGSVGEGVDGLLHLRNQEDETAKKLVSEENVDRKEYFSSAATKTNSTVQEVAQMFSNAMKSRDQKGHWHKSASGSWSQK